MTALSVASMRTDGYAVMPYLENTDPQLDKVMRAWNSFRALPQEVQNRFQYLPDNLVGNSGSGYEPPSLEKFDVRKHTFHAKLRDGAWLREMAAKVHPQAVTLVDETLLLLEELTLELVPFADAFEEEFGAPGFKKNLVEGFDQCILRLLDYPPGYEVGEIIAKQHCDKGGGTLHLRESCSGVERYSFDREWVDFPVGEGQAVVFAGLRMQHLTKCDLKALCHQVKANVETAAHGRQAAVLFLNFNGTPYYNKGKQKSTQTKDPGFNYAMSFDEFDTLFA